MFWKHMIDSDPTDAVPYNNYGNVLNRAGEYQDAVNNYRMALSLNQNYTEAWFNMANATLSDVILRKHSSAKREIIILFHSLTQAFEREARDNHFISLTHSIASFRQVQMEEVRSSRFVHLKP